MNSPRAFLRNLALWTGALYVIVPLGVFLALVLVPSLRIGADVSAAGLAATVAVSPAMLVVWGAGAVALGLKALLEP